jgi:hypothetical protein
MPYTAKTIHLGKNAHGFCFSWVDQTDSIYRSVELNIEQVALLLKQASDVLYSNSIIVCRG